MKNVLTSALLTALLISAPLYGDTAQNHITPRSLQDKAFMESLESYGEDVGDSLMQAIWQSSKGKIFAHYVENVLDEEDETWSFELQTLLMMLSDETSSIGVATEELPNIFQPKVIEVLALIASSNLKEAPLARHTLQNLANKQYTQLAHNFTSKAVSLILEYTLFSPALIGTTEAGTQTFEYYLDVPTIEGKSFFQSETEHMKKLIDGTNLTEDSPLYQTVLDSNTAFLAGLTTKHIEKLVTCAAFCQNGVVKPDSLFCIPLWSRKQIPCRAIVHLIQTADKETLKRLSANTIELLRGCPVYEKTNKPVEKMTKKNDIDEYLMGKKICPRALFDARMLANN